MEMKLILNREELEHIVIDHFQHKGLEPEISWNKDGSVNVSTTWDIESFDNRF